MALDSIPRTLLDNGIITMEPILNRRFQAHDLSRRNRVYRVLTDKDEGFLVKQPGIENNYLGLKIEALALRWLSNSKDLRQAREMFPEFVYYDPKSGRTITRLLEPSTSLQKLHMNQGEPEFPVQVAEHIAWTLATLHSVPTDRAQADIPEIDLRRGPIHNLIRAFHYGWGYSRSELTGATKTAFDHIDSTLPEIHTAAESAMKQWTQDSVIHGDVRWDNFLVGLSGTGEIPRMKLIDWEFLAGGDPLWDVGTYLGEYLRFWSMLCFPADGRNPPPDRIYKETGVMVPCNPACFHESASAFWNRYIQQTDIPRSEAFRRLTVYMPFVVLRIILEQSAGSSLLSVGPQLLLSELPEWLHSTESMIHEFFGIKEGLA